MHVVQLGGWCTPGVATTTLRQMECGAVLLEAGTDNGSTIECGLQPLFTARKLDTASLAPKLQPLFIAARKLDTASLAPQLQPLFIAARKLDTASLALQLKQASEPVVGIALHVALTVLGHTTVRETTV